MEQRPSYGPSIDLAATMPNYASLKSAVHSSGEFQIALTGSRAFGLRLVAAAKPRRRQLPDLHEATAIVLGGTKVELQADIWALDVDITI